MNLSEIGGVIAGVVAVGAVLVRVATLYEKEWDLLVRFLKWATRFTGPFALGFAYGEIHGGKPTLDVPTLIAVGFLLLFLVSETMDGVANWRRRSLEHKRDKRSRVETDE